MTYDRRHISPQHVEARIRAAREERSRTVASYVKHRNFMKRIIDALGSNSAPATSQ